MSREKIIEQYLPLVKKVALRIKNRLPPHVEMDELISAGYMGLVEAANRFDPERIDTFSYFAELKIRGAIYDYLRSLDILSKEKRKKVKEFEEVYDRLSSSNGGLVEMEELKRELGMSESEIMDIMRCSASAYMESLTDPLVEGEESYNLLSIIEAEDEPPKFLEENELFNLVVQAISSLPEREQLVLSLYYADGFTFKEIGKILDITESRVCQIHWRAIKKIREYLEKMGYEVSDGKSARGR